MNKKMKKSGVTLIELLIVVVILAALAMIAIPRVSQSASTAKKNACATNISLINSAIEMYHVDSPTGAWPTALTQVTTNTLYFPDGAPTCPFGTAYIMNATTHRITATTHTHP